MEKNKLEFWLSLMCLVVSIVGLAAIPYIAPAGESLASSGRFFPGSVFALMLLLSLFSFIQTLRRKRQISSQQNLVLINKVALPILLLVVYVLLLDILGYLIDSFLFLIALMLALNPVKKDLPKIICAALVTTIVLYYVFASVLKVYLPAGILGHLM